MNNTSSNTAPAILVIWPNQPRQMQQLEGSYTLHRLDQANDPDALINAVGKQITAVITTAGKGLSRSLIERLPNLEIVASSGVGYDSIDLAACTERGIKVTNTPDLMTDDVADIAIALMLACRRNIIAGHQWVREGDWAHQGAMPLTSSIRGKRLGIVGLGRIGKAIAARAQPMGLEIGYFGRRRQPGTTYHYQSKLIDLASWSDIMILACPGGETTRNLVNAAILKSLGSQGTLINVARGSVVDQPALIEALTTRQIAGAGLDVFVNEPHDGKVFSNLDNVVLYPHHSSGTVETRDAMAQLLVDNLEAYFAGAALLTPVEVCPCA